MYAAFFGISQYPFVNLYLVTKFVPLLLGCTVVSFDRNINVLFTSDVLPVQRILIETLIHCNIFHGRFYLPSTTGQGRVSEVSPSMWTLSGWMCPMVRYLSRLLMWGKHIRCRLYSACIKLLFKS